jgi:hypothetical protein
MFIPVGLILRGLQAVAMFGQAEMYERANFVLVLVRVPFLRHISDRSHR